MPLGEGEHRLWSDAVEQLGSIDKAFKEPLRLRVTEVLTIPAELFYAILANQAEGEIDADESDIAMGFFWNVVASGSADAIVAELPYEEGPNGLEVILRFPHNREQYNDEA